MITMYDEENQDIELQAYNEDLLDNINYDETERYKTAIPILEDFSEDIKTEDEETEIEIIHEEDLDDFSGLKLTKDTLIIEANKPDKKKKILLFTNKKTNTKYEGIVIGKDISNNDKFLFQVNIDNNKKYKIFKYSDLKKIQYK